MNEGIRNQEVVLGTLKPRRRLHYATLFVAALAFTSVVSTPAEARTVDTIMAEAIEAKSAQNYERVVTLLQEAIALQPSPALINNLGSTYEKLGRYGDAVKAYTRVENDMSAPQELRNLDAARRAALAYKIGRIWLVTEFDHPDAVLLVNGELLELEPDEEFGLDRGEHTFECAVPEGTEVLVRVARFPVSRRSTMPCTLATQAAQDTWVTLSPDAGVTAISVNGYRVRTSLDRARSIRFTGGAVNLEFELKDGSKRRVTTEPDRRGEALLVDLLKRSERVGSAALLASPPPPVATASPSYLPLVTAAAGLVGVGVGAGLMALADSQRQEVANATVTSGPLELAPSDEMNQVEAYDTQAEARETDELGTAVLAVGTSVAISGVLWWLLSDDSPETSAQAESPALPDSWSWALGPAGLSLSGRF